MKPRDWDAAGQQLREQLIDDPDQLPALLSDYHVYRLLRVRLDDLDRLIRAGRLTLIGGRKYPREDVRVLLIEQASTTQARPAASGQDLHTYDDNLRTGQRPFEGS